jgi:hypothetical protein
VLLLHTKSAKSGAERVNPMMYQAVDGAYAVFASYAGAPKNPEAKTDRIIPVVVLEPAN